MLSTYIPILLITGFALIFAVAMVKSSVIFGPRKPNKEKQSTYESGMEPIGTARDRFSVKYYMVAVSFIVFDIEIVFLYPWAVAFINYPKHEMMYSLYIALIFIFILVVGLIYEYKKGVLKWD
ncbi:MAG: NADH-quinone oxidoreductase subunit A [Ignavibacteria bacterium]|nr:NADH-quinone oxidoreductase subunit A [Ignavibacteria bacterium]